VIVAIMQPYFFPYLGYFQLMRAVDCFVFYDNAQYSKGGWVNRNRILQNGKAGWWTFPVSRENYKLPINQRSYSATPEDVQDLVQKLEAAYAKAAQFKTIFPQTRDLLERGSHNIAEFNQEHLIRLARSLGIQCKFLVSSQIPQNTALTAQDRVIDICLRVGASHYINSIGGLELYDQKSFQEAGIQLGFIKSLPTTYPQLGHAHVPFLSIIDILMFNSQQQAGLLLKEYESIKPMARGCHG